MSITNIVPTKGKGRSWETNKKLGFKYMTVFRLEGTDPWPFNRYQNESKHSQYLKIRANFNQMLGARRDQWNVKTFKHKDNFTYFYTKDLDWFMLAKLHGFTDMLDTVYRVEELQE